MILLLLHTLQHLLDCLQRGLHFNGLGWTFLWNLIWCNIIRNSAVVGVHIVSRFNWFDWTLKHVLLSENWLNVHCIDVIEIRGLTAWHLHISFLWTASLQRWRLTHHQVDLGDADLLIHGLIWCRASFTLNTLFLAWFSHMNLLLLLRHRLVALVGELNKWQLNCLCLSKNSRRRLLDSLNWFLNSFGFGPSSFVGVFHWLLHKSAQILLHFNDTWHIFFIWRSLLLWWFLVWFHWTAGIEVYMKHLNVVWSC